LAHFRTPLVVVLLVVIIIVVVVVIQPTIPSSNGGNFPLSKSLHKNCFLSFSLLVVVVAEGKYLTKSPLVLSFSLRSMRMWRKCRSLYLRGEPKSGNTRKRSLSKERYLRRPSPPPPPSSFLFLADALAFPFYVMITNCTSEKCSSVCALCVEKDGVEHHRRETMPTLTIMGLCSFMK
jgi:hypothetical protein